MKNNETKWKLEEMEIVLPEDDKPNNNYKEFDDELILD